MRLEPEDVKIITLQENEYKGSYAIEPLPSGYGHTLGNALRRVLLSSLPGWAVTQAEIVGASHQFSYLKGVKEDLIELTLNFKKIEIAVSGKESAVCEIDETGPKVVKVSDIKLPAGVVIANPDLVIATLADKNAKFKASLLVESGFGYVPSEEQKTNRVGVILLDAIFSPITNVAFSVSPTRMGQKTGLDRLTIDIKTDRTISPKTALMQASDILQKFFMRVATGEQSLKDEVIVDAGKTITPSYKPSDVLVDELRLPTRTINALKKAKVKTLEDLGKLTDEDLLKVRNLGEKSIKEIAKLLKKEGLKD
ncbi:DNA-directed RNA polymerase subunit alpha [Candidatus Parcubacteria bacterium]|nr:DNA-directed RNA polymerase subunit alpha [Patescibacteria group bacterium]MBU4381124.1 DNA-directed RNA polymerase subunit alpha [Patescibacteria group bacterium]MCG2689153.1 DNA-directed RNA polymerase subunit alpha [Candidatus Parcubacteria bacterium]